MNLEIKNGWVLKKSYTPLHSRKSEFQFTFFRRSSMISAGSHFLRYTHCTPRWLRTGTQLELVCRRHSLVPWNGSYQECQAPFRFIPRTHHTYLFFVSAIFLQTNSVFPVALFDPFLRVTSTHLVNKKKELFTAKTTFAQTFFTPLLHSRGFHWLTQRVERGTRTSAPSQDDTRQSVFLSVYSKSAGSSTPALDH